MAEMTMLQISPLAGEPIERSDAERLAGVLKALADRITGDLQAAVTQEILPLDTWSWVAVVCDFEAGEVSIYIDDHLSTVAGGLMFDATTPDTPWPPRSMT